MNTLEMIFNKQIYYKGFHIQINFKGFYNINALQLTLHIFFKLGQFMQELNSELRKNENRKKQGLMKYP